MSTIAMMDRGKLTKEVRICKTKVKLVRAFAKGFTMP